ncbi:MAG TPA: metallophosphoesterase [Candidatus Nanoarchaeia archaeon]|nr:metallophosphoesterase [Candidatus Nanoarchaeia archaeon]
MIQKEIVILGDVEMGAGNLTDDFISDNALSELILELGKRPHPVDLVLNGDTFDFQKCPHQEKGKLAYPRHITEKISLAKLKLIYLAHKKVFSAWKEFLDNPYHRLYFTIGNHDMDLAYQKVRKKIRSFLGKKERVRFLKLRYRFRGVYAEHGQQYDFLTKINFRKLFLRYKGKEILNIPFVPSGLISQFMKMKEEHPFLERITPRPLLFQLHKDLMRRVTFETAAYFFKSIFYYPLRYFFDPTHSFPKNLFQEFYRRVNEAHWDIDEVLPAFKKKKKKFLKKWRIYVLGHVHKKYLEDNGETVIVHPGCWRDEYILDKENKALYPIPKRYVQILVSEDDSLRYELKEVPLKRSILNLEEVKLDEKKQILMAAEEEGFKPRLVN